MYSCKLHFQDTRLETFVRRFTGFVNESKMMTPITGVVTDSNEEFWKNCRLEVIEKQDHSALIRFTDEDPNDFVKNEDDSPVKRVDGKWVYNDVAFDAPLKPNSVLYIYADQYGQNNIILSVALIWQNEDNRALREFVRFAKEFPGIDLRPIREALSLPSPRKREPSEADRIRTTLMTWAKESGKYSSYADAAAQLGIDIDTRRNHERNGWFYSNEEMQARGGYEVLWETYTTQYRKS